MNGYQNLRKSLILVFFPQLSHKTYDILKIKLNEQIDGNNIDLKSIDEKKVKGNTCIRDRSKTNTVKYGRKKTLN